MSSERSDGINLLLLTQKMYLYTSQGDWEKVVELWKSHPSLHSGGSIMSSNETDLQMAINDDRDDIVEKLVGIIEEKKTGDALVAQNKKGETPLHSAAARGSKRMCDFIVQAGVRMGQHLKLLRTRNNVGETPMYVAVLHNHKDAFISLVKAVRDPPSGSGEIPVDILRKADGDNVLHSAIRREHFGLAFLILHLCSAELSDNFNDSGETPLHVLAKIPSAFRSGYHAPWWKRIIYSCTPVDRLKDNPCLTTEETRGLRSWKFMCPENCLTCYQLLSSCNSLFQRISKLMWRSDEFLDSEAIGSQQIRHRLHGKNIFSHIKDAKEKHTWSVQILEDLLQKHKKPSDEHMKPGSVDPESLQNLERPFQLTSGNGDGEGDKDKTPKGTDTALVVAAKHGVLEIVEAILKRFPKIIPGDLENKNILMVAVENKQPRTFLALGKHFTKESKKSNLWNDLLHARDPKGNTLLHLAAHYDSRSQPWLIYGAAMQMNCEIMWYKYVKSLLPSHYVSLVNEDHETPEQMFNRNHEPLVENSNTWLKDTTESCSVVAALVATVSFETSSSFPGGTKEGTGKPNLQGRPAFDLFAVTALIMFLSLRTSRKQPEDFMRDLPLKLLLGLSSLFVSTGTMLISFCAAHFFAFEDEFKNGLFPLYAATCLPISLYAFLQFPLYADLWKAAVTKVPQSLHRGHL